MRDENKPRTLHDQQKEDKEKNHQEELIDESLKETFPASDPPTHLRIEGELKKDRLENTRKNQKSEPGHQEKALDESGEETFPASDPPSSHKIEGEIKPEQVEENKNKTAEPKKPEQPEKKTDQRIAERERANH